MGCVLCNITNVDYFGTEAEKKPNPFYCETLKEREGFLIELAYDIAVRHPEMVKRINQFVQAEKERLAEMKVGDVSHYQDEQPS